MAEDTTGQVGTESSGSHADRLVDAHLSEEEKVTDEERAALTESEEKPITEEKTETTAVVEKPPEKEPEAKPEETTEPELTVEVDGQRFDATKVMVKIGDKEYPLSEVSVDIEGNIVKLPNVKDGYLMEKDYRHKTTAVSERAKLITERDAKVERFVGLISKLEEAAGKPPLDLEDPDKEIITRKDYVEAHKEADKATKAEAEIPKPEDLDIAYKEARVAEWQVLLADPRYGPHLKDHVGTDGKPILPIEKQSELFRRASAYMAKRGEKWASSDPLCDRIATQEAYLEIQSEKAATKITTVKRGVQPETLKPIITTGGGGGSAGPDTSDDAFKTWFEGLTAEERQNPYLGVVTSAHIKRYEKITGYTTG